MLTLPVQRRVSDELMDTPGLEPRLHARALAGLRRINLVSRTARTFLPPVLALAREQKLTRLTMLDVASGGGDVPIALARMAAAHGVTLELTLLDRSATAMGLAASAAARANVHCRTIQATIGTLPGGPFDVVTNSLFLHHLPDADRVVHLLTDMRRRAARMILISDLRRSTVGLAAAWLGTRVLSRSPIVHFDGTASVRAAFTIEELRALAERAGLEHACIRHTFPFRMLLTWRQERAVD